jgi:hypothetical protein
MRTRTRNRSDKPARLTRRVNAHTDVGRMKRQWSACCLVLNTPPAMDGIHGQRQVLLVAQLHHQGVHARRRQRHLEVHAVRLAQAHCAVRAPLFRAAQYSTFSST